MHCKANLVTPLILSRRERITAPCRASNPRKRTPLADKQRTWIGPGPHESFEISRLSHPFFLGNRGLGLIFHRCQGVFFSLHFSKFRFFPFTIFFLGLGHDVISLGIEAGRTFSAHFCMRRAATVAPTAAFFICS